MATKAEAEQAIRHLATEWARESGYVGRAGFYPSFVEFRAWLEAGTIPIISTFAQTPTLCSSQRAGSRTS